MTVPIEDLRLLLELQANPLAPDSHLAKNLGVAPTTIKNRMDRLLKENVLRKVSAIPNHLRIGLEHHSVLVKAPYRSINTLIHFADYHNYISYYTQCSGAFNGLFMQFMIPKGTGEKLRECFHILEQRGVIDNFIHIGSRIISRRLLADVKRWNPVENDWNFSFRTFRKKFDETATDPLKIPTIPSIHKEACLLDFVLLRELTKNARRKQIQVLKSIQEAIDNPEDGDHPYYSKYFQPSQLNDSNDDRIKLDKYLISDRMKFLKKNKIIAEYPLLFDRSKFKLFNMFLFQGQTEPTLCRQLFRVLNSQNFPFTTGFELLEGAGEFIWWMETPPQIISFLTNFIKELCDNQVNIMLLDSEGSKYWFYHENYDDLNKDWKKSYRWLVEIPLQAINLI